MIYGRNKLLIGIAIALSLVRFVLMPWIDHQSESRDFLQILTQRYERSAGLVESRELINRQFSELSVELEKARSRFPVVSSFDEYRLLAQQELAVVAQDSGVAVSVFDVIAEGDRADASLRFISARIQIQGSIPRVARFHGELEGLKQNAVIRSFRMDTPLPAAGPDDMTVQAVVLLDMYFRSSRGASSK